MRTLEEIENRLSELHQDFETSENSYFEAVASKQKGEAISSVDFMQIESEYEIIKKEIETLEWVLKLEEI